MGLRVHRDTLRGEWNGSIGSDRIGMAIEALRRACEAPWVPCHVEMATRFSKHWREHVRCVANHMASCCSGGWWFEWPGREVAVGGRVEQT